MSEKVMMPDGHGGYKQVDAQKFSDGSKAKKDKQEAVLHKEAAKASWERIGKAAENFNGMHKSYGTDFNLEAEEVVKAMYLEILNWREYYPLDMGGPERFDALCKEVFAWFEENKNKK